MKTTLIVLCLLCAPFAAAQNGALLNNHVEMLHVPEYPQHASQHDLGAEQSLLQTSAYHVEHGEVPLSELGGSVTQEVPLGDVARAYRNQHLLAKKAEITLEK